MSGIDDSRELLTLAGMFFDDEMEQTAADVNRGKDTAGHGETHRIRSQHRIGDSMAPSSLPLRIVFYKEEGEWVAHCLEFDLIGDGSTKEEAILSLVQAISIQIQASVSHNNLANLFSIGDVSK